MENRALITFVAVVCLLVGTIAGWSICDYKNDQQCEQVNKDLKRFISDLNKSNVDSVINTLGIAVKGRDTAFMLKSLMMAKEKSSEAGGYGAERIQEIENKIKLEHPLDGNQQEGVKR